MGGFYSGNWRHGQDPFVLSAFQVNPTSVSRVWDQPDSEKSGKNNNFDRSSFSRFRRQQNWTWTEKNWNYFPFFTLTPTYLATFQPTYLPSAF